MQDNNNYEIQYLNTLRHTLAYGLRCVGRNGDTIALCNTTITADCSDQKLPVIRSKTVNYQAAIVELIWFLHGDTNVKYLHDNGVHIWDLWADDDGELGPIYGWQWLRQLFPVLELAKTDPFSRRLLVNSWQLDSLQEMNLVPCHYSFQIVNFLGTDGNIYTDLVVNMRSSDAFIGMPFNLVNYGVLLHIITAIIGTKSRNLHINSANFHIYESHIAQVTRQLGRKFDAKTVQEPRLIGTYKDKSLTELHISDFEVVNYKSMGRLAAPVHK